MVLIMKEKDLRDMANRVAGEFQSESDFEEFTKALRKQFWESTREGELDDDLGYEKHEARGIVLIACVDGMKGFPEAIANEYPDTKIHG